MRLIPIKYSEWQKLNEEEQDAAKSVGAVMVLDWLYDIWFLGNDVRECILIGGRGTGKTYSIAEYVAHHVCAKGSRCMIMRDEKESIKESIFDEISDAISKVRYAHNASVNKYEVVDKETGESLVFAKGFRASDNEKKANLKAVSRVDICVIEEGEDIRDSAKYNTLLDSFRKDGAKVFVLLNTPDMNHFFVKQYFNLTEQVEDGYYRIEPKIRKGFKGFFGNFENNPMLNDIVVSSYRERGNPESSSYDKHYYLTSILGLVSTGRKGQVFTKFKIITEKEYLDNIRENNLEEIYGQDFGTASPAALVGAVIHKGKLFVRELSYRPMTVLEIAKLYCQLGFDRGGRIVADHADKAACEKLKNGFTAQELSSIDLKNYPQIIGGFDVVKCKKDLGIDFGISAIKQMELFITENSLNLLTEIYNYCYAQDKFGNWVDKPIDNFNHALDALRYIIVYYFKAGKLRIGQHLKPHNGQELK